MRNVVKKSYVLFLIIISFALSACVAPWARKIAEMKVTWESDVSSLQFTVSEDDYVGGFGYAINSNDEEKEIYFCWSYTTVKFLVYLVVDNETDFEKIMVEDNIVLYGSYAYHNKKDKQIKLTLLTERYTDKLFNGLYDSIILSVAQ